MAPVHVASFRLMPARTSRQNHNAVAHGYRDFPPKMRKVPLPHEGQFVVRARMEIVPPFEEQLTDKAATTPIGANGDFRVWVRGRKKRFESYGSCRARGGALMCSGSVSGAELDYCNHSKPGVHDCRVDDVDAGAFTIETRPGGIVTRIEKRLELLYEGSDTGPYLNLVEDDAQNHDFLLERTGEACTPGNAPQRPKK